MEQNKKKFIKMIEEMCVFKRKFDLVSGIKSKKKTFVVYKKNYLCF